MSRNDSKLQEENIAAREKGLIVAREFDRVVRTFNKVLKYKENCAKCLETDLQGLAESLQENLDNQNALNRNFEIFDSNSEKIILNLQQLEGEERNHVVRYERLLRGIGIDGENPESEDPCCSSWVGSGQCSAAAFSSPCPAGTRRAKLT